MIFVSYVLNVSLGVGVYVMFGSFGYWDVYVLGLCYVVLWFDVGVMVVGSGDVLFDGGVYLFNVSSLYLRLKLSGF